MDREARWVGRPGGSGGRLTGPPPHACRGSRPGISALVDWYLDAAAADGSVRLRREIVDYLARHATDAEQVWAAEIIVGEILANAVEHANGPIWVSVNWSDAEPELAVHDLGDSFALDPTLPENHLAESGRGLFLVAHLAADLDVAAKRAGGKVVTARLPVTRPEEISIDPAGRSVGALPGLDEAEPGRGFGKEAFLRALVVQLAQAVERDEGPVAAQAAVAQVGTDVGGQMEAEYRLAHEIVGQLTPEQMVDCYVRLKRAIDGDFYPIEISPDRVVLGNRRCPFGEAVRKAPALCRMTSSVFGGIAARNVGEATVVLEERIAVGDPECRVVVHLGGPAHASTYGHRYTVAEPPR